MASYASLAGEIDQSRLACLNEDAEHTLRPALENRGILQSDADEQLLISIGFRSEVRLGAIKLRGVEDRETGEACDSAPAKVRLFVNRPDLGFDDAESDPAVQELDLTRADALGSTPVELKFVKFQKVDSIQIFVQENHGDAVTQLTGIEFYGMQGELQVQLERWKHEAPDIKPMGKSLFGI
uniref:PITH domain-containing protein n=1 Tax=Oxyrrhis marina TaxID=2969 RepID=A0A7S3XGQ2_OXYMA